MRYNINMKYINEKCYKLTLKAFNPVSVFWFGVFVCLQDIIRVNYPCFAFNYVRIEAQSPTGKFPFNLIDILVNSYTIINCSDLVT